MANICQITPNCSENFVSIERQGLTSQPVDLEFKENDGSFDSIFSSIGPVEFTFKMIFLPEQKKAYYSWDIHSRLTFVRSRQIVPKTCFDRKARFDQSAGRFGNQWKMTGVSALFSHRSDP